MSAERERSARRVGLIVRNGGDAEDGISIEFGYCTAAKTRELLVICDSQEITIRNWEIKALRRFSTFLKQKL